MTVTLDGECLTLAEVDAVARRGARVALSTDTTVRARIDGARAGVERAVTSGEAVYGITTLFGGLADVHVDRTQIVDLQRLALWHCKSTTGPRLPEADVRAAMLLRANSLMRGASGVRIEVIERLTTFLNAGVTPHVYQRGSIGASGDLVPLSYIGGAILGLAPDFLVDFGGETIDSHTALSRLGLEPLDPAPKEGLALNNGTGASTGVAANAILRALDAATLALGVHALFAQALLATDQSFHAFIHAMKPHPGQVWTAAQLSALLAGSNAIHSESEGRRAHRDGRLIQDRYGIRCLPQFLGPVIDGLALAARQIQAEANTANDNPLIHPDTGETFHTGNFLAQYTSVAMDSTRYLIALMCKHIDSQTAHVITPPFSNGLPAALVGNPESGVNVGLKSLNIGMNQMVTQIAHLGTSVADRFPTHAEMFNQNINSQAMTAANLARDQMDVVEHFLAAALLTGLQAVECRARIETGSCDARAILSPATVPLYEAVRQAAKGAPDTERPTVWNDMDGFLQPMVEGVIGSITARGDILAAVGETRAALHAFAGLSVEPASSRTAAE